MQAPGPAPRIFRSVAEAASDALAVARSAPLLLRAHKELNAALRERVMVAVSQVNTCSGCTRVRQRWAPGSGSHARRADGLWHR